MKWGSVLFAAGLLAAAPAFGADVDYAASRIGFTFKQMNVPVEGTFRRFTAQLQFDAAKPDRSRAAVEVDLASIDTGSSDGDDESQHKSWFDVEAFPKATFQSNGVRRLGPDRYEISGTLTIKGHAQDVAVPVTIQRHGGTTMFDGAFTIKRLAFNIGEGVWADTDTVADEVQVRFRIVQRETGAKT
jgi:polyisoprenoid-binding protein YceI